MATNAQKHVLFALVQIALKSHVERERKETQKDRGEKKKKYGLLNKTRTKKIIKKNIENCTGKKTLGAKFVRVGIREGEVSFVGSRKKLRRLVGSDIQTGTVQEFNKKPFLNDVPNERIFIN